MLQHIAAQKEKQQNKTLEEELFTTFCFQKMMIALPASWNIALEELIFFFHLKWIETWIASLTAKTPKK